MLAGEEANEGGGEAYGAGMGVDVVATYLRTGLAFFFFSFLFLLDLLSLFHPSHMPVFSLER